jgi:hypothetical protein
VDASRLQAIQERLERATPQPWVRGWWGGADGEPDRFFSSAHTISRGEPPYTEVAGNYDYEEGGIIRDEDAEFIAHAPSDIRALLEEVQRLRDGLAQAEAEKNLAYSERNKAVAGLARAAVAFGWRAGVRRHEGAEWEDDWRTVLFIDLPSGQVSWHFHDSERALLDGLPAYEGSWDGHSTDEKWERVSLLAGPSEEGATP